MLGVLFSVSSSPKNLRKSATQLRKGFTLAELLISLAILGVIATFTIPKILISQQNSQNVAKAKEAVAMVSEAYIKFKAENTVTTSFNISSLTPYMNYVREDTTSSIDYTPGFASFSCSAFIPCLKLHDGAMFAYGATDRFCGLDNTGAVFFYVDPDGVYGNGGTADGPSKSVVFWLYPDGRITTFGTLLPGTLSGPSGCVSTWFFTPSYDPSWFNWN